MKKSTVILIIFCTSITGFSQTRSSGTSHEGFYLSFATGPAMGKIHYGKSASDNTVKGDAFGFDLQIGGAIQRNLILHAAFGNKTLTGPKINGEKFDNKHSVDESFYGVGVTRYTDENFFFTGNVGVGHFTVAESRFSSGSNSTTTDGGFSFNVKAGKEWMVSRKWGVGGAIFYGKTTLRNARPGYSEHWNSDRFGLYLHATLCKSK